MDEISEITDYIQEEAGSTADVIWGHGYDESLGDKLCVTIIATGFNTTPHTGLSMKAPKKNIMNLEDESLVEDSSILENENSTLIEETKEEQIEYDNISETATKRFVLNEEDSELENETENKDEQLVSTNTIVDHDESLNDDGKVRFLLEEDESSNTELKNLESPHIVEANPSQLSEEPVEDKELKTVESKAISDERLERIRKATEKLRSPLGLNEMESEPAYKRRNVDLKDVQYSDEQSSSRYTLWENINENGEKETGLSDNNSFLHDNVD
jgi:cell division protein FtsZ